MLNDDSMTYVNEICIKEYRIFERIFASRVKLLVAFSYHEIGL